MQHMTRLAYAISVTLLLGTAGAGETPSPDPSAASASNKIQTTCPVMGGAIDKALYVDHDGKRIYVCCPGCLAPVKADPAKFIKKLELDGVTLDPVKLPTDSTQKPSAK